MQIYIQFWYLAFSFVGQKSNISIFMFGSVVSKTVKKIKL